MAATTRASGAPAYYAAVGRGAWGDWWTLLHPPYTAWLLSYVVIGAALADRIDWVVFGGSLLAFLLAVGVGAHAFDELHGRPLRTAVPSRTLAAVGGVALFAAAGIGAALVSRVGLLLIPLIAAGVALVVTYNFELLGGFLHTDLGFALSWGAFPVVVGFVAQARTLTLGAALAALAATALSYAQRTLSTPARALRRHVTGANGQLCRDDGSTVAVSVALLLAPLEAALRALSYAVVLLATGLAVVRWY